MPVLCKTCGKDCSAQRMTCDSTDEDVSWCPECFNDTPCGKGEHGEGCPTMLIEVAETVPDPDKVAPATGKRAVKLRPNSVSGLVIEFDDGSERIATTSDKEKMLAGLNVRHYGCNICGFTVDAQYKANRPTADFTFRGRQ